MASRKLSDLHPHLAQLAAQFKDKCHQAGIEVLIYCTLRTSKEQDSLYAQGRTAAGRKVTNAKGGYSYHNYGLAFDCVPTVDGRLRWDDVATYEKMGAIGRSLGLVWGGDFKSFKDRPHFQWSDGLTITQLRNGMRPRDKGNGLQPSAEEPWRKAVSTTLVRFGIIQSPDYWLTQPMWEKAYVEVLILNSARKFANIKDTLTLDQAIDILYRHGVMASPEYWKASTWDKGYIEALIANIGKKLEGK